MGLIEVAREVKSGKKKLADVPEGSRRHVQRLLPLVGEPAKPLVYSSIEAGPKLRIVHTV